MRRVCVVVVVDGVGWWCCYAEGNVCLIAGGDIWSKAALEVKVRELL